MIEFLPEREVAVQIGGWAVRWYGIFYVAAYLIGWWLVARLGRWRELELAREQWLEVAAWAAAGALIGGRLGYVLFYEPVFFWNNPGVALAVWQGGMSIHGGLLGIAAALGWQARLLNVSVWRLGDVAVVPGLIGLALGRVGNVINEELYQGAVVAAAAILYPLALAAGSYWLLTRWRRPGVVLVFFLIGEGAARFAIEWWRVDQTAGVTAFLTRGHELALVTMFLGVIAGAVLWRRGDGGRVNS